MKRQRLAVAVAVAVAPRFCLFGSASLHLCYYLSCTLLRCHRQPFRLCGASAAVRGCPTYSARIVAADAVYLVPLRFTLRFAICLRDLLCYALPCAHCGHRVSVYLVPLSLHHNQRQRKSAPQQPNSQQQTAEYTCRPTVGVLVAFRWLSAT